MKIKNHLQAFFSITIITAFLVLPFLVFAQPQPPEDPTITDPDASSFENASENNRALNKLKLIGGGSGYKENVSLASAAGQVVRAALSLLGIIFIFLIVIGGYKWMMAGGNEENVKIATNYIKRAIIGLIVILSAWAIWFFIISKLAA